jgi:hypothetical protein
LKLMHGAEFFEAFFAIIMDADGIKVKISIIITLFIFTLEKTYEKIY